MNLSRTAVVSLLASVSMFLMGCPGDGIDGGDGGALGSQGPPGAQGPAGPAVVTLNAVEAPGGHCTYGGVKVQFGPDIDGDLVLDVGEINPALTQYVCNGTAGIECWDLNSNHGCDLASEDKNADATCDVADCHTPNGTDYIQNAAAPAQAASFNVSGGGIVAGALRSNFQLRVDDSVNGGTNGDHDLFVLRSGFNGGANTDRFVISDTSGFVARGILGVGVIPATGQGERLMWHPNKGAFRAGSIGSAGVQWDDPNVGYYTWAGGYNTVALGLASFAMGYQSTALGSYANALGYTSNADGTGAIAIGYRCTADADYSTAIGQRASTNGHAGAIVFSDGSTTDSMQASANNQFSVRAAGGYRLFTNATMTTGVSLAAGGSSWAVISDRNAKTRFESIDSEGVLKKIAAMPLQTWVYKEEVGQPRHVGPMAQDFRSAFGLGVDDKTINTLDIDGINMVAIQALAKRTEEVRALSTETSALRRQLDETTARLRRLEQRLEHGASHDVAK